MKPRKRTVKDDLRVGCSQGVLYREEDETVGS